MTTIPTAEKAICLYLYGQNTPPSNLKTDLLIRPLGNGNTSLEVDINEYMSRIGNRPRFISIPDHHT